MEKLCFKNKELVIKESINNNTYKVLFKNKIFLLKTFNEEDFIEFIKGYKELKISGIKIPKIIKVDKKGYKVLLEDLKYETTALDLVLNETLSEKYFQEIFKIAWYAKHGNISIEYRPHNFALINDELYYLPLTVKKGYDKATSFELEGIRYWFFTKEFYNYATARGIALDKSKIKDEYKTNKDIVLAVCRYQR